MFERSQTAKWHQHDDHASTPGVARAEGAEGIRSELTRDPEAHRTPLERGAAAGRWLYFDAFSGAAGDMCVAALVDLGVPFQVVRAAVAALELPGVSVELHAVAAGAIGASRFDVVISSEQPERSYVEIRELLERAPLALEVRRLAQSIFGRLARAESQVHRVELDAVHFHEVGAVDSIADVVAAAACFEYLGGTVLCSPLPLGRGHVHCRHGVLPLPAPAAVLCLDRLITYDGDVEAELVTPTGAAILGELAESARWPELRPLRTGWGRGTRELPDRPNALRVVLGEPASPDTALAPVKTHVLVECNLDDATGEQLGAAIDALLAQGALDAWAAPLIMKKGRPGWMLSALGPAPLARALAEVMLRETSTIGVRLVEVRREELSRRSVLVRTPYGEVPVKVSGERGTAFFHVKPEFDVCAELARRHGVSVRQLLEQVQAAALAQLG